MAGTPQWPRAEVERLYADLGPVLLLYGAAITGDRARAEDALHQVFLKLLSGKVPMPMEARPYLFRAMRNAVLNSRRAASRDVELTSASLFHSPRGLEGQAHELERALADLPPDQRQMVVLKVWGGLTLEEAAELAEVSPNTAASRYRYALRKLRERMVPKR